MIWRITAYNGTIWDAKYQVGIFEAINLFFKETGLCQVDIKKIENVH